MSSPSKHRIWTIACVLYLALLLAIVIIADLGKIPVDLLSPIPHYDTIAHFLLYGIASFLSHRATNRRAIAIFRIPIPLGPFLFALVTVAEEFLQQILRHRTFSWLDLGASLLGIILFYGLGELWFPRKVS